MLSKALELPLKWHIAFGVVIRLVLILYADYHDANFAVRYTDIDYKVFTDAARHVVNGKSPYLRKTYRYSPIIAYLMVPNILLHKDFGKLLFGFFDILVTIAVNVLVTHHLKNSKANVSNIAKYSALLWLYNPLSIAISTRGNADSFPCFIIIMSLLFLQTDIVNSLFKYVLAGSFLGLAIHLRLYPIVFSFPMYLSLGKFWAINLSTKFIPGLRIFLPDRRQMLLSTSCTMTLLCLTYAMSILYGYEFLYETYIYHLVRKDIQHNFSVLFYSTYLTSALHFFNVAKTVTLLSEVTVLFLISLAMGANPKTLPMSIFCQSVVCVAYNSVMTSQYFIWFLSLLPLVAYNLSMTVSKSIFLSAIWILAQAGWLFFAYQLEFLGKQVFFMIWLKCILFFLVNTYVLGQIIMSYNTNAFYVDAKKKRM